MTLNEIINTDYTSAFENVSKQLDILKSITTTVQSWQPPLPLNSAANVSDSIKYLVASVEKTDLAISKVRDAALGVTSLDFTLQAASASNSLKLAIMGISSSMDILAKNINGYPTQDLLFASTGVAAEIVKAAQPKFVDIKADYLSKLHLLADIGAASKLTLAAEGSLSRINFENFGSRIGLETLGVNAKQQIMGAFNAVTTGYSELFKSFEKYSGQSNEVSPDLINSISVDYFQTAKVLEFVSVEEKPEEDLKEAMLQIQTHSQISLFENLAKIDPRFIRMWEGAQEALTSNNLDKIRHFSISIREIINNVILFIAPNKAIKSWTQDRTDYIDDDLKKPPKKRTQLRYICRNISANKTTNNSFENYLKKEIAATVEFIDVLNTGTHEIDSEFSDYQLIAIRNKAVGTLNFLLDIHLRTNL